MVNIKRRSPALVLILEVITFGIYGIYWIIRTKEEINSLGADIPTVWLLTIPVVDIYFFYKYAEGFSTFVKKDNNVVLWFLLLLFLCPVAMVIIQAELNKLTR